MKCYKWFYYYSSFKHFYFQNNDLQMRMEIKAIEKENNELHEALIKLQVKHKKFKLYSIHFYFQEKKRNSGKPETHQALSLTPTQEIAFELHNEILLFQKFNKSIMEQSFQEFKNKILPKIKETVLKASQNAINPKVKN